MTPRRAQSKKPRERGKGSDPGSVPQVLAAERLALEVPAVEVEREAVHEHDRQGRAVRSLAVGVRRHLVDLRMQHQAVVAGDGDRVRVQGTQPVGLGGPRPACAHHPALDRHPGRDSGQGRCT